MREMDKRGMTNKENHEMMEGGRDGGRSRAVLISWRVVRVQRKVNSILLALCSFCRCLLAMAMRGAS